MKTKCILFNEVPEGTKYQKGAYSFVPVADADKYIEEGYGMEYSPTAPQPPNMDWFKDDIKEHMDRRGIEYNSGDTKADLLEKIEIWEQEITSK